MTKLSQAVIACISATMMLPSAAFIAAADTFTYQLNGTYAESNGGPSLVPYGGTLGPTGYTFGVQQGLSLSGSGAFDSYSIDIHFFFDALGSHSMDIKRFSILRIAHRTRAFTASTALCSYLLPVGPATPTRELAIRFLRMARWPTC